MYKYGSDMQYISLYMPWSWRFGYEAIQF